MGGRFFWVVRNIVDVEYSSQTSAMYVGPPNSALAQRSE